MTERDTQTTESAGEDRPSRFGSGGPRPRPEGGDSRPPRRFGGGGRPGSRRKVCAFCMDNIDEVDYKDMQRLRRHLSERGKIEPRRKTGACARHQRSLTVAIKRARHVALLPFVGGAGRP
ncbi:MAG: 30S ribosomal protein S18 [Thermomicrobiales bacterium]|nr:30S ribosomal protein S18 [Thermomicrobiales bacterium]MCC6944003.1 30S ribosomal protein S18 [Thermomicrobiales bacterium]